MDTADHTSWPDQHLDPTIAAAYDGALPRSHRGDAIDQAVAVLAELAGDGTAVEFAIGTGRVALPLSQCGTRVLGIDFSEPMLHELRMKAGADQIQLTKGDIAETTVCDDASLVYLVFNTIGNLRSQEQQAACFRNAAAHLKPGGRFVIENNVPKLHQLSPGETIRPFDVSPNHLGFDEYVDRENQILISHHYFVNGDTVRRVAGAFRYVWPSELDLMAQLAGMTLESRWSGWDRRPYDPDGHSHVSTWVLRV